MAQKIQFIASVLHEPEMLILDEPLSGFDPVNVELILNELMPFAAVRGIFHYILPNQKRREKWKHS